MTNGTSKFYQSHRGGPPSGLGAGSGARNRDRMASADLMVYLLTTVPSTETSTSIEVYRCGNIIQILLETKSLSSNNEERTAHTTQTESKGTAGFIVLPLTTLPLRIQESHIIQAFLLFKSPLDLSKCKIVQCIRSFFVCRYRLEAPDKLNHEN
ncbi:hypothetical protein PoB_007295600 [Plakobranchus ocellatus]|uniref:Uncharacterized protein n=1 Tax=Plakobranchus ocellatus TaxID=259542 RepID=A0AAV4DRD5_9GAST|nr:hypothetical protein PoB_007295600 [Plakobranchus ocellatus]